MGVVALFGGKGFEAVGANREVTVRLLGLSGASEVVVLPTADAFEEPQRAIDEATAWFATLGAAVRPLMVLTRSDASDAANAAVIDRASFVYLVGDSPLHLRSSMKDTVVWAAIVAASERGVVAASGASAAAICDPMTDPRGGAFGLGLGLIAPLAVVHEAETWSFDRLHRARQLSANFATALLPSGTALVRVSGVWSRFGDALEVTGELPG